METVGKSLVLLGAVLAALGVLLWLAPGVPWLGRLPGDLRIERDGATILVPITSCLLVSVVASIVLQIVGRLR